eukprot:gene11221-11372_t
MARSVGCKYEAAEWLCAAKQMDWDNHPAVRQYSLVKRLGEGGFSEVQLARDRSTGKTVALKIVFLNKAGLNAEQRRILHSEARLIRMVAHPNIIRCFQVFETRRQQVLVLQHLSGGEMLQQLQRIKRYSEVHACQLFRQVVDAVAYLHSLGIMHRDIKPENCLLAKPSQHYAAKGKSVKVKLIDLGMAGLYRPARPLHGCMGSPGFIAPEAILGEPHSPAMDVYSLGVLLFIMLVGRKPWGAQHSHTLEYAVQQSDDAPGLADPAYQGLSPAAKELLIWMLKETPLERPTAQQVLHHRWTQGAAAGGCVDHLIQPVVQQRLRVLGNSRQIMRTAHGMLRLHSKGSRSSAVAFHQAVNEARLKLQQQAALINAAESLNDMQAFSSAQGAAAAGAHAANACGAANAARHTSGTMPLCGTKPEAAAEHISGQQKAELGSQEDEPGTAVVGLKLLTWALALLDADDRMCLMQAGTSAEDACFDNANLFSWSSKRGAAEMVASFKRHYGVRPIARSIARFGQSLSMSINRSLKHSADGLAGSGSLRSSLKGSLSKQPPQTQHTGSRAGPTGMLRGRSSSGCSAIEATYASAAATISPTLLSAASSSDLDQLLLLGCSEAGAHADHGDGEQPPQPQQGLKAAATRRTLLDGTAAAAAATLTRDVQGVSIMQRLNSSEQESEYQCFRVGSFTEANALVGRDRDLQEQHGGIGGICAVDRSTSGVDFDDVEEVAMMQAVAEGPKVATTAAGITETVRNVVRLTRSGGPGSSSAGVQRISETGDPALLLPLLEEYPAAQPVAEQETYEQQLQHGTWLLGSSHDAVGHLFKADPGDAALQSKHHVPAACGGSSLSGVAAAAVSTRPGTTAWAVKAAGHHQGDAFDRKGASDSADGAGGVAWLIKSLSGKYSIPEEGELQESGPIQAAAHGRGTHTAHQGSLLTAGRATLSLKTQDGGVMEGGAYGSHKIRQQHQATPQQKAVQSAQLRPTFDDFDEPTTWYYAS